MEKEELTALKEIDICKDEYGKNIIFMKFSNFTEDEDY